MISLDHIILPVHDPAASLDFYRRILGLEYVGRSGPFEIVRVNSGLTLDLMAMPPKDSLHIAFNVDQETFDAVLGRLIEAKIPYGGDTFERDGKVAPNGFGAQGIADAVYFYDPNGHNLEIRVYK